jgi:excisionase family DNA binding protein
MFVAHSPLLSGSPVLLDALNRPLSPPAARAASPSNLISIEEPDPHPAPVLLTIGEVAVALRISKKSVRRRIKSGTIRTVPTGGRLVRISSEELRRLAGSDPPEAP